MIENQGIESGLSLSLMEEGFEKDLVVRPNWSVEGNFMLLPIFSFDRKSPPSGGRILKAMPTVHNQTLVTQQITVVTGQREVNGKLELDTPPGEFDMNVLFALMDLWDEQGKNPAGVVEFTFSLLSRRLRVNSSGKNFHRMRDSVLRLARTRIESKNAFYSKEKGTYLMLSMGILAEVALASNSGGRHGGLCRVSLDRNILKNLQHNFSARIDRKVYQSIDSPLAQRIFCIARFKEQILAEVGVLDFDVMQLADLIPMVGKLFPSLVVARLKRPMQELEDRGIFRSEFIKTGKTIVLRIHSMERKTVPLVGIGQFARFLADIQFVYGKPLEELVGVSNQKLQELVTNDKREQVEYLGRKYSWVFHVLDVFADQLDHGYEPKDKVALLEFFLKQQAADLKIRIDFEPVDLRAEKRRQSDSLKSVSETRNEEEKVAADVALETAQSYVERLQPADFEAYLKRVCDEHEGMQFMKADGPVIKNMIASYVKEDILKGKELKLSPEPVLDSSKDLRMLQFEVEKTPTAEEVKEAFSHLDREAALSPEGLARRKEYLLKQARELASE